MKKIVIALATIATLAIGYVCFINCCPPDCCKSSAECKKVDDASAAVYKMDE